MYKSPTGSGKLDIIALVYFPVLKETKFSSSKLIWKGMDNLYGLTGMRKYCAASQSTCTCSKLTIETLEPDVKYVLYC